MSAAEQLGSVIEPANLANWKDQILLSDAFGDGVAYYVQQHEDIHQRLVNAYENGDMELFGRLVADILNHQLEEWK